MAGDEQRTIESREYKVVIDATLFADAAGALHEIRDDLHNLCDSLDFSLDGDFNETEAKKQTIRFLDTRDFTLRDNTLLLRQRVRLKSGRTEYTLKCRSADRYFAQARNLQPSGEFEAKPKFEEDISAPFTSGFSQSQTIEIKPDKPFAGDAWPQTLQEASQLFPVLRQLEHDGLICAENTPLETVNGRVIHETVYKGPMLRLPGIDHDDQDESGEVALIVWRKGPAGRGLTAELSFRITAKNEQFPPSTVIAARKFFAALQRQDWVMPVTVTKTQFMYGT